MTMPQSTSSGKEATNSTAFRTLIVAAAQRRCCERRSAARASKIVRKQAVVRTGGDAGLSEPQRHDKAVPGHLAGLVENTPDDERRQRPGVLARDAREAAQRPTPPAGRSLPSGLLGHAAE